ncbi:hypothetical protein B0T17DRAFT_529979 [Bombardia bombarda]|uniref:Uncharacterized protein n=1 Tax=Bombardia bombarda TaxID=252184 RepID=A0AA40CAF5_9PEZI|nr:hypothetical protein B0T17DRAFT_529979 [Bombardia bombarda]
MPGGSLHWPLWVPYALYGEVDHMYGFKQWNAGNGFTSAQGFLNAVETLMYLAYVGLWYRHGQVLPAGAAAGQRAQERAVAGRAGALAVVVGYSAAVMTLSKTVLYWMNEYFSGFDNIGHNDLFRLVFCFIIPNGLWLLYPSYMIYDMGSEIVSALGGSPSRAKTE